MRLAQPFDLNFADEFADPLAGLRLLGGEPDTRRRLRQHHFGQMPIQVFKLGLALEAQHDRIPALACFGDRRVELRKFLQAGQLVDDEPHALLRFGRFIQQAQYEPINP